MLPRPVPLGLLLAATGLLGCAQAVPDATPCLPCQCPEPARPASSAASSLAIPYDLPRAPDLSPPPAPEGLPGAATGVPLTVILTVDITAAGALFVDGRPVRDADELMTVARAARARSPEGRAVIRADRRTPWGDVVGVMDRLKQAAFDRIAFGVDALAASPR